jgi:tuftelin-interacting protein 11
MIHGELKRAVREWDPLREPGKFVREMAAWKLVIQTVVDSPHHTFDRAVVDVLMPKLRRCIAGSWNVFQPSPVVSLLHRWNSILSDPMYDMVMTQLIVPKLQRSLEHWKGGPRGDPPLHVWLLPWAKILGAGGFQPLSDSARLKLSSALSQWQPGDESAQKSLGTRRL